MPVVNGFETEPCAWPTAVHLRYPYVLCSGVYVGGTVVMTAAHCVSTRFQVDLCCESDADCPDVDDFGNEIELSCTGGSEPTCLSTASLVSNDLPEILFGEKYDLETHPRRAIPALYCVRRTLDEGPGFDDIGYCILREEPGLQAVPMIMECEAEGFVEQGMPLVAVGFGKFVNTNNPIEETFAGDKRHVLATNMSNFDLVPSAWVGASPGAGLAEGDSGGPLFGRLPDGTWRVLGIASSAVQHVNIWSHFDWMFENPHVAAQREKLLPCLGPEGQWEPTAACGGFPRAPDVAQGDWARGPFACYHNDLSGPSDTCGPPFMPFSPLDTQSAPPPDPPMHPQSHGDAPNSLARGAAVLAALGALLMVVWAGGAGTRSRRWRCAVPRSGIVLALFGLGACPPGGGGGTDTAGETTTGCPDPGPGSTLPTEGGPLDPGENANYRGVLGGTNLPAAYTIVRVGHVDLPDPDGCCSDYVVAGPAQNHVRVLIGAAPPHGLVFLSELSDQIFEMGPADVGIEDVVVADYDEDGHDDVLALRSDGVVGIRRGLGVSAPASVLSDTLLEVSMNMGNFTAGRALALAELNCTGKRDLLAIVTNGDRLHVAAAGPGDTFSGPTNIPVPTGSPQHLVIGQLNDDDRFDIVTANGDASFSVLLSEDCDLNFSPGAKYPIFAESAPSPGMQVAVGRMCLGATSKDWPSVAVGYGHTVIVFCGDSAGTFDAVNEEDINQNNPFIWDYRMDWDTDLDWGDGTVFNMQYWDPTQSLHVHWSAVTSPEIARFVPTMALSPTPGVPVAELGGPNQGHASALFHVRTSDGPQWTQIVVLGDNGGSTDIKFAR